MSFVGLLEGTCTVQAKSETQLSSGEVVVAWSDKATNVKCRMQTLKNPLTTAILGNITVVNHRFYFQAGTDITQADRIVFNGDPYEVIGAPTDSSGDHIEVSANRIRFD